MEEQKRAFGAQFATHLNECEDEVYHGGIEIRVEIMDDGDLLVTVVKVLKEFEPLRDYRISPDGVVDDM